MSSAQTEKLKLWMKSFVQVSEFRISVAFYINLVDFNINEVQTLEIGSKMQSKSKNWKYFKIGNNSDVKIQNFYFPHNVDLFLFLFNSVLIPLSLFKIEHEIQRNKG